jgi:glycosyltransferase involved in cell wall biosynthesis
MTSKDARRILLVDTKWEASGGSTVNREVAIALARLGHHVTVRLGSPAAGHPLVDVQGLEPIPGIPVAGQLLRTDGLPPDIDTVIGNGRWTGGAALYLRDQCYPRASVVHVVHALQDDIARLFGRPESANERARTDRELITRSDLAVGFGPLLAEEAARLAQSSPHPPLTAELPPGIVLNDPPQYRDQQTRIDILMYCRSVGDRVKGPDVAANAVQILRGRGRDVRLTMIGADPAAVREQERLLVEMTGAPLKVRVKPFAGTAELSAEMRGADLLIQPSRSEGFGLTALEAAGHGLPILVAENSGLGRMLCSHDRVPLHLGPPSVVPMTGAEDAADLANSWANQIEAVVSDLPATRQRAADLREHLGTTLTWERSAQALVELIDAVHPKDADAARIAGLDLQPHPRQAVRPRFSDAAPVRRTTTATAERRPGQHNAR